MILAADGTRLPGLGGADLERVELDEDLVGEVVEFARVLDSNGVRLDSIDEAGPGGIEATVEGRRVVLLRGYRRRAGAGSRGRHGRASRRRDLRPPFAAEGGCRRVVRTLGRTAALAG